MEIPFAKKIKISVLEIRVLDTYSFNADPDPDPAFELNTDPDPDQAF